MNLGRLKEELSAVVRDQSLEPYFEAWINDAILEIATDYDLPALKLIEPVVLPVTTANWIFDAPASFHKGLFRCVNSAGNPVTIRRETADLDDMDYDHDETGDNVTHVAVLDTGVRKYFCVYPKAADSLRSWFYEFPNVLEDDEDVPLCIPEGYHARVILPKVVVKNFRLLQDLAVDAPHQSLKYWEDQFRVGMFGSAGGDIGLINLIVKSKKPRRHGGRDPLP